MPEIDDVILAETITVQWGNDIRDRTIQRYADDAERASLNATPSDGDLAFMEDTGLVFVYFSTGWYQLVKHAGALLAAYEVDNATEVATVALGATFSAVASVSLAIPSDWGSWKCIAQASWSAHSVQAGGGSPGDHAPYQARLRIDGTDQQILNGYGVVPTVGSGDDTGDNTAAIVGRRAGMTTTGSRTVALRAFEVDTNVELSSIALYARAIRTG